MMQIITSEAKDAFQVMVDVMMPPISGPEADPIPAMALISANARARDFISGKETVVIMYMGGIIRAEPIPSSSDHPRSINPSDSEREVISAPVPYIIIPTQ